MYITSLTTFPLILPRKYNCLSDGNPLSASRCSAESWPVFPDSQPHLPPQGTCWAPPGRPLQLCVLETQNREGPGATAGLTGFSFLPSSGHWLLCNALKTIRSYTLSSFLIVSDGMVNFVMVRKEYLIGSILFLNMHLI